MTTTFTHLVTKPAPVFTSSAVIDGEIVNQYTFPQTGKYYLVFFYPLDFTFVCPTEIVALNERIEKFKALNVEVVGVSVDSQFVHLAWTKTPLEQGGIGAINFPLVADVNHHICRGYGIEHEVAGVALRAAFLIDKSGIVRHQVVNDLPLGRNINELLRTAEALQHFEQKGEVCPAGWLKGKAGMTATPAGVAHYLGKHADELKDEEHK